MLACRTRLLPPVAGMVAQWQGRFGNLDAATGQFIPVESRPSLGPQADCSTGYCNLLTPGAKYVGVPAMDSLCTRLMQGVSARLNTKVRVCGQ